MPRAPLLFLQCSHCLSAVPRRPAQQTRAPDGSCSWAGLARRGGSSCLLTHRLLSQEQGKDQYRWVLKRASLGGPQCPCTALCDHGSHSLGTGSFSGSPSYLGCWKGRKITKKKNNNNNPNGEFTVSVFDHLYCTKYQ